jgi:putative polyhydroxyalkanoate system protein
MADIHIVRNHTMPLKKARQAADEFAGRLAGKFDLDSEWHGDTMHFERPGVHGTMALGKGSITIDVRLGLLLSAFKSTMEEQIERQLDQLFDQAATAPARKAAKKKP